MGIKIASASAAIMAVAGWHSISYLDGLAVALSRFHDWAQLRIRARRAGLVAYRAASNAVLKSKRRGFSGAGRWGLSGRVQRWRQGGPARSQKLKDVKVSRRAGR